MKTQIHIYSGEKRTGTCARVTIPVLGGLCLMASTALAGHPITAVDTGNLGKGTMEVAVAAQASGPFTSRDSTALDQGIGVSMGLFKHVDVGVSVGFSAMPLPDTWEYAMGDPVVGAKYVFLPSNDKHPGLALAVDYKAPQDTELSSGEHETGIYLANSWDEEKYSLHLNLGATRHSRGEESGWTRKASVAAVWPALDTLTAGVQLNYAHAPFGRTAALSPAPEVRETEWSWLAGLAWAVREDRIVSLGAGRTWGVGDSSWMVTIGFTTNFSRKGPASPFNLASCVCPDPQGESVTMSVPEQ